MKYSEFLLEESVILPNLFQFSRPSRIQSLTKLAKITKSFCPSTPNGVDTKLTNIIAAKGCTKPNINHIVATMCGNFTS